MNSNKEFYLKNIKVNTFNLRPELVQNLPEKKKEKLLVLNLNFKCKYKCYASRKR